MSFEPLNENERKYLLRLARTAIETAARSGKRIRSDDASTPRLKEKGASFVTLTLRGQLRGCIGTLEAYQPLAEDVIEHSIAAALNDPRFYPVQESELGDIHIEISRLTPAHPLEYSSSEELLQKLRPQIDGVILRDESHRATFLPQVWEQIPEPSEFLDNLCYKMGLPSNEWRKKYMDVSIYEVEEFHE